MTAEELRDGDTQTITQIPQKGCYRYADACEDLSMLMLEGYRFHDEFTCLLVATRNTELRTDVFFRSLEDRMTADKRKDKSLIRNWIQTHIFADELRVAGYHYVKKET